MTLQLVANPSLTAEERYWAKVDVRDPDECWPWTAGQKGGEAGDRYGSFWLDGHSVLAHRFAWCLATGIWPPKFLVVRHKCDYRLCQNITHLESGTNLDNVRDKVERGRCARLRGETNSQAKLTESDAREIIALYRADHRAVHIAERYSVARATVADLVAGRTWKHLQETA